MSNSIPPTKTYNVKAKPDLSGQKSGKWTAIAKCDDKRGHYHVKCDCGTLRTMKRSDFVEMRSHQCIRCRIRQIKISGRGYA